MKRDQYLRVRIADFEGERVDVARGEQSRSEYVRGLIEADLAAKGLLA